MSIVQTLTLAKVIDGENTEFFLHSVTQLVDSRYVPGSTSPALIGQQNGEGPFIVKIYVMKDTSIEEFPFLTPVLHLFSLDDLNLDPESEDEVEVQVYESTTFLGGEKVRIPSSYEKQRPIF